MLVKLQLETAQRNQFINITDKVINIIKENNIKSWICVIYTPHTTCWITINEWADPDVQKDIINQLSTIAPYNKNYFHIEWNSDSHIKSSIIWSNQTLIIENEAILLWTWQQIFFCEFDWPRTRNVFIKIIKDE